MGTPALDWLSAQLPLTPLVSWLGTLPERSLLENVDTGKVVGVLRTRMTRKRAQDTATYLNSKPGPRPITYHVRRVRLFKWEVFGTQNRAVPTERSHEAR